MIHLLKDLMLTGFPPMLFQIFNLNIDRLLRACTPPPALQLRGWGLVKNLRKVIAGRGFRKFYFGMGGLILLGGGACHVILK